LHPQQEMESLPSNNDDHSNEHQHHKCLDVQPLHSHRMLV